MTREELWAVIQHHARQIHDTGVPTPYWGSSRALQIDEHAQRISELCHQVYPLDKKWEEEQMGAKQAMASLCQGGGDSPPLTNRLR